MKNIISKRYFFTSVASILLSVFMVAVVAYGASTMDTASVGAGTSTPGAALGVKGEAIVEGFVHAGYFRATSSANNNGFGTSSPGTLFSVQGVGNIGELTVEGPFKASFITATSTTATSTVIYGLNMATSSLMVNGRSGNVTIGTSSPQTDGTQGIAGVVDPALVISGVGSTFNATGTLYVTGGGTNGGQIILKATDRMCISIMANSAGNALDVTNKTAVDLLTTKVIACPR